MPLYIGKGSGDDCNSYMGQSLLAAPGKVYGRVLNGKMKITNRKVGEEQEGFR